MGAQVTKIVDTLTQEVKMPGELLVKPTSTMQIDPAGGGKNDINLYLIVGIHSL